MQRERCFTADALGSNLLPPSPGNPPHCSPQGVPRTDESQPCPHPDEKSASPSVRQMGGGKRLLPPKAPTLQAVLGGHAPPQATLVGPSHMITLVAGRDSGAGDKIHPSGNFSQRGLLSWTLEENYRLPPLPCLLLSALLKPALLAPEPCPPGPGTRDQAQGYLYGKTSGRSWQALSRVPCFCSWSHPQISVPLATSLWCTPTPSNSQGFLLLHFGYPLARPLLPTSAD